jgi:hypothetical protein
MERFSQEPLEFQPFLEWLEERTLLSGGLQVVLIDGGLRDSARIAEAAIHADRVVVYDNHAAAPADIVLSLEQISETSDTPLGSVSIISHGRPGAFDFGNAEVSAENLWGSAEAWRRLGTVLAPGASLSIYGCSVGGGPTQGQALLDGLAALTGADVLASDDVTGAGGDWNLEKASSGAWTKPGACPASPFETRSLQAYAWSLNDAPVANADEYTVTEDGTLTVPAGSGVLANDTDAEGDPLSAVLVAGGVRDDHLGRLELDVPW